MRRAWAAQTILTVLLAFVGAPLLHVHMAEKHGHDGWPVHRHETVIHAHLPDAHVVPSSAGYHDAELSHTSHGAEPLEVFAVVPNDASLLAPPFVLASRMELVPAAVSVERPFLQSAPRTHDPPLLDPSIPRAPPA